MRHQNLIRSLALGLALAAGAPAQAAESDLPARAATLVGQYIAQQGNAALIQIREELKQDLTDALRPLLPTPETKAEDSSAAEKN